MDTLARAVYDMTGPPLRTDGKYRGYGAHEAPPAIDRRWDFYGGARPGSDTFPATIGGQHFSCHNVWGEAVPVQGSCGPVPASMRLHVKAPEVWHLDPTAATDWVPIALAEADDGTFQGGYFRATAPYGKTLDLTGRHVRKEELGWSIDLVPTLNGDGTPSKGQGILHFFWTGFYPRLQIPAGGAVAIHTRVRLISDDPTADLDAPRWLTRLSGDLFTGPSSQVNHTAAGVPLPNPPLALPRFKLLSGDPLDVGHVTGDPAGYPRLPFLG